MNRGKEYLDMALSINNEIIENRRSIHKYAETGFDLPQTLAYVIDKLKEYGYDPQMVGKAGISCTVGKPGKTILLRADMDALPMEEKTDLEFAATNGNCHSCGHDSHTAMLLATAKLLKANEDKLNGTVKFMFQPAEELLAGAQDMIDAGILENPKVDAAVGIHIAVALDSSYKGSIQYAKGTALFSGDAIKITIKGKNSHGSTPYKGIDAINIAAHIVIALQEIVAREIPSADKSVVLVGKIKGGDTVNTTAGHAELEVSVRAETEENRAFLKNRVKEIAENVASTFRGEAVVDFVYGIGPLYNDPNLSTEIAEYTKDIVGEENVIEVPPVSGSEDFTAIAAIVPSVMLNLGVGSIEEGYIYSQHNPQMIIDESTLHKGAAIYAYCAEKYLENN